MGVELIKNIFTWLLIVVYFSIVFLLVHIGAILEIVFRLKPDHKGSCSLFVKKLWPELLDVVFGK